MSEKNEDRRFDTALPRPCTPEDGSNVRRRLYGDHALADWKSAGLLFPSTVTGILRTVERGMIGRKLGSLSNGDREAVDRELRRTLGL